MITGDWYILTIIPGGTLEALSSLRKLGCEVISPVVREKRAHRRYKRVITVTVPRFPGYVFVRHNTSWRDVLRVKGVTGVLQGARGEEMFSPVALHPSVVEQLNQSVDSRSPDLVELLFRIGDKVRLTSGPFVGYRGTVEEEDGKGGVRVVIGGPRKSVAVSIPQEMAEAV